MNGNKAQSQPDAAEKKNRELSDKLMSDKIKISARIQKLLEVRQAIAKMGTEHLRNCSRETMKGLKLKSSENGYCMETGENPCDKGALINFSMIAVCD